MESDNQFYCRDGKVAKSLDDLSQILKEMSEDEFLHHVNEFKNDFSEWIRQVILDESLAGESKNCRSRHELQLKIEEHLMRSQVTKGLEEYKQTRGHPIATQEKAAIIEIETMPELPVDEFFKQSIAANPDENVLKKPPRISEDKPNTESAAHKDVAQKFDDIKDTNANEINEDINQLLSSESSPQKSSPEPAEIKIDVSQKPLDKQANVKGFTLKEFVLGLALAFVLGFVACIILVRVFGWS